MARSDYLAWFRLMKYSGERAREGQVLLGRREFTRTGVGSGMADREEVPGNPLVLVEIDSAGRLIINGYEVPSDGTVDPRQLAVAVVCSDFARPLGRPVRALVDQPHGETTLVVHPDGRVSDVQAPQTAAPQTATPQTAKQATPHGVPPATRAQAWLAGRDADRAAAEAVPARHLARRRRYPVAVAGGALVALGLGLVVFWTNNDPVSDPADQAAPRPPSDVVDAAPDQPIVRPQVIRPIAVSGVTAEASPGVIRLDVAAQRRTTVTVVVTRLERSASPQGLTLSVGGEDNQLVTVPDLEPGKYRWEVMVPGQPRHSGVVQVPEDPPAEVTTVPVVSTPEEPDTSEPDTSEPDTEPVPEEPAAHEPVDPPQPEGVHDGPNHPVDPDGD
jgi:hypothetical protein